MLNNNNNKENTNKGIDYVLQKSMTRKVSGLSDVKYLQDYTITLNNRSGNKIVEENAQKRKQDKVNRRHKWLSLSTRKFREETRALKKGKIKYNSLDKINQLWTEYADQVGSNEASVAKMDLHGSNITVSASPDPSLVGVSGRIVKETYGTLIIVTEKDEIKQINKNHTVVDLHSPKGTFELNLTGLQVQPYLKPTRKWKKPCPVPLPY